MRSSLAERFVPALDRQQCEAGLCRLQRHQSGDGRARRRRDRADRLSVRRCRHHRLAAKAARGGAEQNRRSPRFYASGPAAPRFATLRDYGLDIRVLDGALSAASALKMSYAGITKGTQAIGAAMMLAATRAGSGRRAVRRAAVEPEGNVPVVQARPFANAAQGLSLGRRDARDRGLRRRRSQPRANSTKAPRISTRTFAEDFENGDEERRRGARGVSRQKLVLSFVA